MIWLAATLIKLLLGLLTQNQGEIRVNGMNLRQLDLTQYRARIGTVMLDNQLFAGSILESASADSGPAECVNLTGRYGSPRFVFAATYGRPKGNRVS
ncbi:MAG: ATP-binding cassette domain-containing protein [Candidatus Thiodiazotropha sp.]